MAANLAFVCAGGPTVVSQLRRASLSLRGTYQSTTSSIRATNEAVDYQSDLDMYFAG